MKTNHKINHHDGSAYVGIKWLCDMNCIFCSKGLRRVYGFYLPRKDTDFEEMKRL